MQRAIACEHTGMVQRQPLAMAIADFSPGLLEKAAGGSEVPRSESILEESIESTDSNPADVESCRAEPADAPNLFRKQIMNRSQGCGHHFTPVIVKAGCDHGRVKLSSRGRRDTHAVVPGPPPLPADEPVAAVRVMDHTPNDGRVHAQGDRYGEVGDPMCEIVRAIQRIDHPRSPVSWHQALRAFFRYDVIGGASGPQNLYDLTFRIEIGLSDEPERLSTVQFDLAGVVLPEAIHQGGSAASGRFNRQFQIWQRAGGK